MKNTKIVFNSADLELLGKSLAASLIDVESAGNNMLVDIWDAAQEHAPLNAVTMTQKAKKGFRADITKGLINAKHLTDGTRSAYASAFFKALVFASNGLLPNFEGKVQEYNKLCSEMPEGRAVYPCHADSADSAKADSETGKGAAKSKAETKKPSEVETLTEPQIIAKMREYAAMLGWENDIDAIITAHLSSKNAEKVPAPKKRANAKK